MSSYRKSRKIVKNIKKRLLKYSGEYIDIVDVNNSREVRILKKFGKKKTAHEKLDSVNILKEKIVDRFNSGKKDQGFRLLKYLIENQKNNCLLLSKSLCELSKEIKDKEVLIYILDSACNLKYPDRIAVCSYGNALAEAGRYDDACEKFERCIELFGEDVNVLGSYGKALADNGRFDEAYKMFERYIELFGEDEIVLNSYGKALADNGRFEEAYEKFERCTELFGDNEIGLSTYGRALADNGRFEEAYEKNEIVLASHGIALADSGRFEEAYKKFERCTELFGENEIVLNSYGIALADDGRFEEAYEKFERCTELFGENEIVLNSYGRALADNGRFEEAYVKFEQCTELFGENETGLSSYGRALADNGRFEEAYEKFERCTELFRENEIVLSSYGRALADNGCFEEAYEKFERCTELFGEDEIVLTIYGKALADNGRFNEAYKKFDRCIELFGEDEIALNSYGRALTSNGRFEEAYEKFERCTELFGENEIGLNSYGRALADNGRFEEAYEKFERCTELFGENEIGLNIYGIALAGNRHFEEAYEKFERCTELFGENKIVLTNYGKALADNGRFEEAYEKFENVLSISKDDQITLFLYAVVLEKGGNFSEAALKIEAIIKNLNGKSDIRESTFFYFTLGRLYYYNKQTTLGDKYLQLAINNAAKRDKAILQAANIILSTEPFSRKAAEMLQEITESSKQHVQALRILSISLPLEEYFYQFSDTELESEMKSKYDLYRHIIHKIKNQVSLLRFHLEEIIKDNEENSNITALQNIKEKIYNVFKLIQDEKDNKIEPESNIDKNDYRKIISEISKLSHDITDKISNALYIIKYSIPLLDTPDESLKNDMNIFMKQLDTTIITLNTLKSINEGIKLNLEYFKINELIANLKHGMRIKNAVISLELVNKNDTFYGDKNKIREIVNELIENSVKHNENNENLTISVKAALTKDPVIHSTNYKGMFLDIVIKDS
ncbi:MAG: tetratricopeptide repeat protein [Desulfobacteraceae bacterium]|nr:tetratricopeptide repeat protein [Desulfobacteraceae bacterium]